MAKMRRDVAARGRRRAQHADLARALEDAHRDRVDERDHADRDDQQAEHGDRHRDLGVGGDLLLARVVVDERADLVAARGQDVLERAWSCGRSAAWSSVVVVMK